MNVRTKRVCRAECALRVILTAVCLCTALLCAVSCGRHAPAVDGFPDDALQVGEGATVFGFAAFLPDGSARYYRVATDRATVGEALIDNGLIEGENGPFGLYVKTVCGVTVDYDTDGKYWAFYIGEDYATSGVDTTGVSAGTVYSLRAE